MSIPTGTPHAALFAQATRAQLPSQAASASARKLNPEVADFFPPGRSASCQPQEKKKKFRVPPGKSTHLPDHPEGAPPRSGTAAQEMASAGGLAHSVSLASRTASVGKRPRSNEEAQPGEISSSASSASIGVATGTTLSNYQNCVENAERECRLLRAPEAHSHIQHHRPRIQQALDELPPKELWNVWEQLIKTKFPNPHWDLRDHGEFILAAMLRQLVAEKLMAAAPDPQRLQAQERAVLANAQKLLTQGGDLRPALTLAGLQIRALYRGQPKEVIDKAIRIYELVPDGEPFGTQALRAQVVCSLHLCAANEDVMAFGRTLFEPRTFARLRLLDRLQASDAAWAQAQYFHTLVLWSALREFSPSDSRDLASYFERLPRLPPESIGDFRIALETRLEALDCVQWPLSPAEERSRLSGVFQRLRTFSLQLPTLLRQRLQERVNQVRLQVMPDSSPIDDLKPILLQSGHPDFGGWRDELLGYRRILGLEDLAEGLKEPHRSQLLMAGLQLRSLVPFGHCNAPGQKIPTLKMERPTWVSVSPAPEAPLLQGTGPSAAVARERKSGFY